MKNAREKNANNKKNSGGERFEGRKERKERKQRLGTKNNIQRIIGEQKRENGREE